MATTVTREQILRLGTPEFSPHAPGNELFAKWRSPEIKLITADAECPYTAEPCFSPDDDTAREWLESLCTGEQVVELPGAWITRNDAAVRFVAIGGTMPLPAAWAQWAAVVAGLPSGPPVEIRGGFVG